MKSKNSEIFLSAFVIITLCLCTIINAVKYKTMILSVNSKTDLNSREKTNKMLEKYKLEISNFSQ